MERSAKLAEDLERFRERGYAIPEPGSPGVTYSRFLVGLSENDPQAFICHFYNVYFAHSSGGRMIGKMVKTKQLTSIHSGWQLPTSLICTNLQVAEKLLDKKELEFYNWDGDLRQLLQNVKDKLNQVSQVLIFAWCLFLFRLLGHKLHVLNGTILDTNCHQSWTREQKDRCLDETARSFKYSGDILHLILI